MQGTPYIPVIFLAATAAWGQIELTPRLTSVTLFASGGARVEMEGPAPTATGAVCWLNLPFDELSRPGYTAPIELSPATLFDGPPHLGVSERPQTLIATDIAGLLAANTGAVVEVRAGGTNELYRGRLKLSGDLALIEETTNHTVAIATPAVTVVRRLDGPLRTQRQTTRPAPALLATCVSTNTPLNVRLAYVLPGVRWLPAYELAPSGPAVMRLTLLAQTEGGIARLRGVPARFALAPDAAAWDATEIGEKKTVLFSEDVPCERFARVMIPDRPDAPATARTTLRLVNRSNQPWPAALLGATLFPATASGGAAVVDLDEPAPLRVDRRVKEISRRMAGPPVAPPREEVLAVATVFLSHGGPSPLRARVSCPMPNVVEETVPPAMLERDAAGARWLRWDVEVPPGKPAVLQMRYRAWAKPESPSETAAPGAEKKSPSTP
jgi:hypothetical protein